MKSKDLTEKLKRIHEILNSGKFFYLDHKEARQLLKEVKDYNEPSSQEDLQIKYNLKKLYFPPFKHIQKIQEERDQEKHRHQNP